MITFSFDMDYPRGMKANNDKLRNDKLCNDKL